MPNWCLNRVTVCGDEKEVARFVAAVKGKEEPFDFESILPMPKELKKVQMGSCTIDGEHVSKWWRKGGKDIKVPAATSMRWLKKYGATNWYDWARINWGTKWNVSDVELEEQDSECVVYRFETAWGPPQGIFETLCERFPKLSIEWFYDEPGNRSAGYL